ncbi:MAG: UvrD-helicase domain-containing protein [Anaerolineales bacterium]|nr:UvrD-helicase domain-containing protein [Anaerolineales bacterium]
MPLYDHLNAQQMEAVTAPLQPTLVIAGPGSGKTRVLTHRIAHLMQQEHISPASILAVTFTNKAAREMRARVEDLLQSNSPGSGIGAVWLGTFHSSCARILRIEANSLPFDTNFVIFDDSDQVALTRQILKELEIDPKKFNPRKIHGLISQAKNELVGPESFPADSYLMELARRVFELYEKRLRLNNALDFDDLLLWVVRLFDQAPLIKAKYQNLYRHILVDEFQDTNTAQYALLRRLTGPHPYLFVVGDPDQSIYRWRGADIRNIHRFKEDYPNAKTILLEQNYRSTQTILDVAMAVIDRNPNRQVKQLFTDRGPGEKVCVQEAYDEADEAQNVVETVGSLTRNGRFKLRDIAVMYRTNAQSRPLEDAFFQAGLNYRLVGAQRFYGRREIKDLIAYLRIIHNPSDQISLLRVINTPARGIGDKTIASLTELGITQSQSPGNVLQRIAAEEPDSLQPFSARASRALIHFGQLWKNWISLRETLPLSAMMDRVLEDIHYQTYLDDGTEEGEERWLNVLELRAAAEEFSDLGLETFLEHIALVSDQDTLTEDQDAPSLLTLHAAKGLEFPVVIIIGLDDGVLPHMRSMEDPEAMQEERRLFYVGITRAMDRLYFFHAFRRRVGGSSGPTDISRFLRDLPPDCLEGDRPRRNSWQENLFARTTRWESPSPASVEARFKAGMRVQHTSFGEGIVQESETRQGDEEVIITFEDGQTKHLLASLAKLTILDKA